MKKKLLTCMLGLIAMCAVSISVYAEDSGTVDKDNTFIENDETGIPDEALYNAALEAADSSKDGKLSVAEAEALTHLSGWDDISDLTGIEKFINLIYINIHAEGVEDLSPLMDLEYLQSLSLWNTPLEDLSEISKLTTVTSLSLFSNGLSDISAIKDMTQLTYLEICYNKVKDISALSYLTNLNGLSLYANQVEDISALSGLTKLNNIQLPSNKISDITPIMSIMKDHECIVGLANNNISILPDMTDLTWKTMTYDDTLIVQFDIANNKITVQEAKAKLPAYLVNSKTTDGTDLYALGLCGFNAPSIITNKLWYEAQKFIEPEEILLKEDNSVVDEEAFADILETNKDNGVIIKVNDELSFEFGTGELKAVDGKKDYDFGATLERDHGKLPDKIKGSVNKDKMALYIDYNYSGELPGKAKIKLLVGKDFAGKELYYYFCKEDGTFELKHKPKVDENGYIVVEQDHCSSYVVLTEEYKAIDNNANTEIETTTTGKETEATTAAKDAETPNTGDKNNMNLYVLIAFVGMVIVLALRKKETN